MQWKLTHRHNHECIENKGGKTLSYDPNLGIQIIEQDGFAFKDLDNNGRLDPYEDWRLPLTQRIQDFTSRFLRIISIFILMRTCSISKRSLQEKRKRSMSWQIR